MPLCVPNGSPAKGGDDLLMTPILPSLSTSDMWSRKLASDIWDHLPPSNSSLLHLDHEPNCHGLPLDSDIGLRSPCAGEWDLSSFSWILTLKNWNDLKDFHDEKHLENWKAKAFFKQNDVIKKYFILYKWHFTGHYFKFIEFNHKENESTNTLFGAFEDLEIKK
jgi:hypothetical protein